MEKQETDVVILAIDETPLTPAAIKWALTHSIKNGEKLLITCCLQRNVPLGRENNQTLQLRKTLASELKLRLQTYSNQVQSDLKNIAQISYDIGMYKPEQADHIIMLLNRYKPKKILLHLDNTSQPWLNRWVVGDINEYIALRCPVRPTILTNDILRKLEDAPIWGLDIL